jgi:hypothetical protein
MLAFGLTKSIYCGIRKGLVTAYDLGTLKNTKAPKAFFGKES